MKAYISLGIILTLLTLSGCNKIQVFSTEPPTSSKTTNSDKQVTDDLEQPTTTDSTELTPKGEKEDLIYQYFDLISKREYFSDYSEKRWIANIEQAYKLKYKPSYDFEYFKKIYSNVNDFRFLTPYQEVDKNTWKVIIELYSTSNTASLFESTFKIIDEQLQTVSSKELASPYIIEKLTIRPESLIVTRWNKGTKEVVIYKDGKEFIIEQSEPTFDFIYGSAYFNDFKKLENPNYISYNVSGWEYGGISIVDIERNKKVLSLDFPAIAEFSRDNQFYVTCSGGGMAAGYINIYKLPEFTVHKSVPVYSDTEAIIECNTYDKNTNTLYYTNQDLVNPEKTIKKQVTIE
jgi:hypothetical protein